jgi:hypothetical protein
VAYRAIFAGLDIGLKVDFTALTLCEVLERPRTDLPPPRAPYHVDDLPHEVYYHVQRIFQLPHTEALKSPRGQALAVQAVLAAALAAVNAGAAERALHGFDPYEPPSLDLYMDTTGLGLPMLELVREVLGGHEATRAVTVWPCVFVAGQREYDARRGTVGKAHVYRHLQALVSMGRVDLPASDPMTPVLYEEIRAFRFSVDRDGNETLGGAAPVHDDVLCSLALATMIEPVRITSIPFHALGW